MLNPCKEAGGGQSVEMLDQLADTVRPKYQMVTISLHIVMVGIGETVGTPGQRQSSCLCLLFSSNQYMGHGSVKLLETVDNIGNIDSI